MPQPIESLDRPALERRYRRMRLATVALGAASLLLVTALGAQGLTRAAGDAASGEQTNSSSENGTGANAAGDASADAKTAAQQCPVEDRRDPNDSRGLGAVDAPIVLHEWTDFRCPYCGAFSRDTLPVIIDEYVKTGKVRLEIHDAALVGGENSVLIASAARAAGKQGKYFAYYDVVYRAALAKQESHAEFTLDELVQLASDAGVANIDAFRAAVETGEFDAAVRAETAEAQRIGVTGVPFFATSECGQVTSGAHPVASFRQVLDAAVKAASTPGKK